jgi:hypothetical protein
MLLKFLLTESYAPGLCWASGCLVELTLEEYKLLHNYIQKNRPWYTYFRRRRCWDTDGNTYINYFKLDSYWWENGDKAPRIAWIKKHIKKTDKKDIKIIRHFIRILQLWLHIKRSDKKLLKLLMLMTMWHCSKGLCDNANRLYRLGSITYGEYHRLLTIIDDNPPKEKWGCGVYFWEPGETIPRLHWIEEQIKKI